MRSLMRHFITFGLVLIFCRLDLIDSFSAISSHAKEIHVKKSSSVEQGQLYVVDIEETTDFSLVNAATESMESNDTNDIATVIFCGIQKSPALYHTGTGCITLFLPNEESRDTFRNDMLQAWQGPLTLASCRQQHYNKEDAQRAINMVDPITFLEKFRQSEAAIQNESEIDKAEASFAKNPSYNEQIRLLKQVVRLRDDRVKILESRGRLQKPKKRRILSARAWVQQTRWQHVLLAQEARHTSEVVLQLLREGSRPLHTEGSDLDSRIWNIRRRSKSSTPVRLLVLSDTHSMEDQLVTPLPDADILIHCGDYAHDPFSPFALPTYLKEQASHIPFHLVIRGNHDPLALGTSAFAEQGSNTVYVTKATTMVLPGGLVADLRPFSKSRKPQPPFVSGDGHGTPDLIVSHEPPFGLLDETYHKERVGSIPLRLAAADTTVLPSLWLCGHIHEGRGGTQLRRLSSHGTTTTTATWVVNASNANSGKANHLIAGPVVIDFLPAPLQDNPHWRDDASVVS